MIGIRQQRQEAGPFNGSRQLPLVAGFGSGDSARDDLAGLSDIALQSGDIFVIDLLDVFSGEAAEFFASKKT